jgi:hypothetical protein
MMKSSLCWTSFRCILILSPFCAHTKPWSKSSGDGWPLPPSGHGANFEDRRAASARVQETHPALTLRAKERYDYLTRERTQMTRQRKEERDTPKV